MDQNRELRNKATPREQLVHGKGGENTQWGRDRLFTDGAGETGQTHARNGARPRASPDARTR